MPFSVLTPVTDVIIPAKFYVDLLKGFWEGAPSTVPFLILFGTTVTTVLHYRADCDSVLGWPNIAGDASRWRWRPWLDTTHFSRSLKNWHLSIIVITSHEIVYLRSVSTYRCDVLWFWRRYECHNLVTISLRQLTKTADWTWCSRRWLWDRQLRQSRRQ